MLINVHKEDAKILRGCRKVEELGLKMEDTKRPLPKVLIFNVPSYLLNKDILNDVYTKNLKSTLKKNDLLKKNKVVVKKKILSKSRTPANIVLQLPTETATMLLQSEKFL